MSEAETASERATFPGALFGLTGRIGPKQYFIGVGCALLALLGTLGFMAAAMAPTGASGSAVLLGFPFFGLFVWILAAVTVQRLRDAGKPPALAIVFILGPVLLLYPLLELLEAAGGLMIPLYLFVLAAPGFMGAFPKNDGLDPNG